MCRNKTHIDKNRDNLFALSGTGNTSSLFLYKPHVLISKAAHVLLPENHHSLDFGCLQVHSSVDLGSTPDLSRGKEDRNTSTDVTTEGGAGSLEPERLVPPYELCHLYKGISSWGLTAHFSKTRRVEALYV